jgi:hypothetical protein
MPIVTAPPMWTRTRVGIAQHWAAGAGGRATAAALGRFRMDHRLHRLVVVAFCRYPPFWAVCDAGARRLIGRYADEAEIGGWSNRTGT